MANLSEVIIAIICWLVIVAGIYIYIDPEHNATKDSFNNFTIFTIISGIFVFVILFVIKNMNSRNGAYIVPLLSAISELPIDEKRKAHITRINDMDITLTMPIEGGKKYLVKHKIRFGELTGRSAYFVVNCMSDYKSSATDISRASRLESWGLEPLSEVGARRLLLSKQQTPIDKIITASKELKKIKEKGGDSAVDLIEDLTVQEEERDEGI